MCVGVPPPQVPSKHNFLYRIKVHGAILHSDPSDRQLGDDNRKDWDAKKKKKDDPYLINLQMFTIRA